VKVGLVMLQENDDTGDKIGTVGEKEMRKNEECGMEG
jgi:hypothetical protein